MTFDCTTLDPGMVAFCESLNEASVSMDESLAASQADTNMFFLIWGSSLVLFMHAGFAMLSAGAIRSKNNKNILLSIVMDLTTCAMGWFFIGFAFAFGEDAGQFIGSTKFVGLDFPMEDFAFWLFQYCFAATAATIVSGAIAERARFETYLATSMYMTCWVYPVVVHWVWGGGFLTLGTGGLMASGVVDFAGCGPVHMVGGVAGAVAAKIMGPRVGRFDPATGKPNPIPGHSSPLATVGVFILWVGWFGFNCGSVLVLNGSGVSAARAGVTTVLASSAAALSSMFLAHFMSTEKEYDLNACLNGALAGLVSITGCACFVEMWAAIVIGLIGGVVYVLSSKFLLNVLKIDDPLDATPVHMFGGMWGILAGAFFANPVLLEGLFTPDAGEGPFEVPSGVVYGGNTYITKFDDGTFVVGGVTQGALLANAIVEILVVLGWVMLFTIPWFLFWNFLGLLRVDADTEASGIDASAHGGSAYPESFYPMKEPVNKNKVVDSTSLPTTVNNMDDFAVAAYAKEPSKIAE